MAEQKINIKSGFYDSINNDRLYSAEEMNRPYKRIINEGIFATPQGTPSTDIQVISAGDGRNIIVKKGEGILGGKWFENQSDIVLTVSANSNIVPRFDSVIIQVDKRQNERTANIILREGVATSNPTPPDLVNNETLFEKRVANIYVAAGANYINQDAITDLRGSSECLWITSLINQVDTSELFRQWQSAYQQYYDTETAAFEAFMESLTSQLTVNTNIITYESHYVSVIDGETEIPININNYNKNKDVLIVRVNRLFASEGTDYTISQDGQSITLTKDIYANQNVDFLVLQSVVVGDTETVLTEIQRLDNTVSQLNTDSGWTDFTLQNGATAYNAGLTPAYRKNNKDVHIRGCIKGVALNTTFATLPSGYRPAMTRYNTIATGNITATIEIGTNGQMKIANVIGSLTANSLIPIDTQFIIG